MTDTGFDLIKALSRTHAFTGLEDHQLRLIEPMVGIRKFKTGDIVVEMHSRDSDLHLILEGELRVLGSNDEVLADLGPGASVGEVALMDQQPRCATVIAKSPSTVAVIASMELWRLLDRRPELGSTVLFNIGRVLAGRLRSANPAG